VTIFYFNELYCSILVMEVNVIRRCCSYAAASLVSASAVMTWLQPSTGQFIEYFMLFPWGLINNIILTNFLVTYH
jgi:hypothetical protein